VRPWGARSIPLLLNVTAVIQAVLFILCMFGSNWQVRYTTHNRLPQRVGFCVGRCAVCNVLTGL
jgi:hypothetical protein